MALSLRLAAEARADLEQPYPGGGAVFRLRAMYSYRCGASMGLRQRLESIQNTCFSMIEPSNTPIFSRRARDRMIGVCT